MNLVVRGFAPFGRPIDEPHGLLGRLLDDDSGQDIVEYALLGALVGIAAILIWQQLAVTVGDVYGQTVAPTGQVQNLSSCMPGPDGTGC
jgi:Flp pilus assembly pilin Flp